MWKDGHEGSPAAATMRLFPVFKVLSQTLTVIRITNNCKNRLVWMQTCRESWLCVRQGGSLRTDLSQFCVPCGRFSCQLSTNSVTSSVSFPKQDTRSHITTWKNINISIGFPRELSQYLRPQTKWWH